MRREFDYLKKHYEDYAKAIGYKRIGWIRNLLRSFAKDVYEVKKEELISHPAFYEKIYSRKEWMDKTESGSLPNQVIKPDVIKAVSGKACRKIVIPGTCELCGSKYGFSAPVNINDLPSCRETLGCISCRRVRRERVILSEVKRLYKKGRKNIYMYEAGEDYSLIKSFAKQAVGSEYISSSYESGDVVDGILHEDAHALSFSSESFDILVSRDVFEHVSDIRQCLREAYRVLRAKGVLLVTIPWNPQADKNHQRAELNEKGEVINLDVPLYHWNPVTGSMDSLVYWDYGWQFLDELKAAGFKHAFVRVYYDSAKGYLGEPGSYFVAVK